MGFEQLAIMASCSNPIGSELILDNLMSGLI